MTSIHDRRLHSRSSHSCDYVTGIRTGSCVTYLPRATGRRFWRLTGNPLPVNGGTGVRIPRIRVAHSASSGGSLPPGPKSSSYFLSIQSAFFGKSFLSFVIGFMKVSIAHYDTKIKPKPFIMCTFVLHDKIRHAAITR